MKIEMKKYPKIGQLKDVCYQVRRKAGYAGQDEDDNPIYEDPGRLPTLNFEGTVKLHGTNAAVRWDLVDTGGEEEWHVRYQSRNNIITPEKNNTGFAAWATTRVAELNSLAELFIARAEESVVIYGEFCGGNIQPKVALTQLEKMFVVFDVYVDGLRVAVTLPESNEDWTDIFTVAEFPSWSKQVDFNFPEKAGNEIVELVAAVEAECPVGKALGVSGTGEGIVWKCTDPEWTDLMFKTKGTKHSKSPVKVLNPVALEDMQAAESLAVRIMTSERCEQGFEYLTEMQLEHSRKNTSQYLKYVVGDCIAEEQLAINELGEASRFIGKRLSQVAKDYYFARV